MPVYSYLARDRTGRISRQAMDARTPLELRSRLQALDVQLISFEARGGGLHWSSLGQLSPRYWWPVRSRDIELTLHQLAIMLRSGLKLLDALSRCSCRPSRKALARVLSAVHHSLSQGNSLSTALAEHKVFPPLVIQLVNVGEQTGSLTALLEKCKDHLAARRTMLTEVRVAMAYPAVVTAAALSIAGYLILFVIPQLQRFLGALGRDLPAMTQSLVDLADWLRIHGTTLVVAISLLIAGLMMVAYSRRGRLVLDRCLLRLPLIGGVLQLSGTASLASAMAVMLHSGIRLVEAIGIATRLQTNSYLASLLGGASDRVTRGSRWLPRWPPGMVLRRFCPAWSRWRNGLATWTALTEVAGLCDAELKSRVKRLSQLVEPLVIVLAGGIVGYVYIAFFLALMSAGGNIR